MPHQVTSTESKQLLPHPKWVNGVSGERYRILKIQSEGGMGVIYHAINKSKEKSVVKFAKEGSDAAIIRELGINMVVVPVEAGFAELIDWGQYGRSKKPFLVFREIDGQPVSKYQPGRLIDCYQISRKLGELLTKVHARGFVHGDISDKNVLVTAKGNPVIIDFGLGTVSGDHRLGFTKAFDSKEEVASASSDLASLHILFLYMLNKLSLEDGEVNPAATTETRGLNFKPATIAEFCDQLLKLEYNLIADSCRGSQSIGASDTTMEMAVAWTRFGQLAFGLIEYQSKSEEESFGGPPSSTTEVADLRNADEAARLLERWQFHRFVAQSDQLAIARFCRAYATHLGAVGRSVEDAYYLRRAIEVYELAGFPTKDDEFEYSRYLNVYGHVLGGLGRHTDAAAVFIRSLAVRARLEPGDSPLVAQCLNNLSGAFNKFPRGDSIALYLEAKKFWTGAFGPDNSHRSWALHNIGRILSILSNHDAAKTVSIVALEMKQKALGETHPQVAFVLANLAQQYGRTREFAESFRLFEVADKLRTDCYGHDSPTTLGTVNEWAKNLIVAKEPKKSYDLLMSRYSKKLLGSNNFPVRDLLVLLADVCRRLRRPVEARRFALERDAYTAVLPKEFVEVGAHQKAFDTAAVHLDEDSRIHWRCYLGQMIARDEELLSPKRKLQASDLLE